MIKVVTFFLIGMIVLAMFGKLRVPGQKRLQALKCSKCGSYRIGKSGCACGKRG